MKLMMYLGNDLIESVNVNFTLISTPGYLGSFKRSLKQKHSDLIQQVPDQPEFLVVNAVIDTKKSTTDYALSNEN
jgi:hypothetical protein